jgi:hypothetical protein
MDSVTLNYITGEEIQAGIGSSTMAPMAQLCLSVMGEEEHSTPGLRRLLRLRSRGGGCDDDGSLRTLESPTPGWCSWNVANPASFRETCVTAWPSYPVMNGMTKTPPSAQPHIATGVFASLFSHEHGLVLRQAADASRPLMMTWLVLFLLSVNPSRSIVCLRDMEVLWQPGRALDARRAAHTGPVPEMEEAERVRASGEPLEAIRLLREYLQANPYHYGNGSIAEMLSLRPQQRFAAALDVRMNSSSTNLR